MNILPEKPPKVLPCGCSNYPNYHRCPEESRLWGAYQKATDLYLLGEGSYGDVCKTVDAWSTHVEDLYPDENGEPK